MGFDAEQHRRVRGFYVSFFRGCQSVLDVACGRGEFLEVLRKEHITCRGVDSDEGMVRMASGAGNTVEIGDAFSFLQTHPSSFDGIFSAHFIEHLPSDEAARLIELSHNALQPGGRLLLATPNSASLPTLQREFWWDPTHVRFYDMDLLRFWFTRAGFRSVVAGENPESHPGSPIGVTELEVPPAPRMARFFDRLLGLNRLRHHQIVLSGSLRGLIQQLYKPSEIYVTGLKATD